MMRSPLPSLTWRGWLAVAVFAVTSTAFAAGIALMPVLWSRLWARPLLVAGIVSPAGAWILFARWSRKV